ncbi:MAG TPA: hypothetical protein VGI60_13320 [Chthoniobacterales bacterium]|jgi:hypothetical protein
MRIFNRSHIPWFLFVILATIASLWIYLGNFDPAQLPPGVSLPSLFVQDASGHRSIGGTPVGLVFGTISFAIFIFGALLSLRKRIPLWPIGTIQQWMRAHIWLTLLTIPLVLFHSGFRLGSPMTTLLMSLYAVVMISGIYGLYLQHRLPRLMTERLPSETVYQQIPFICSQLYRSAKELRDSLQRSAATPHRPTPAGSALETPSAVMTSDSAAEASLVTLLEDQVLPYLKARRGDRLRLGDPRYAEDAFRFVSLSVGEKYRQEVDAVQGWCEERRMLDLQLRLHRWLHAWLFVHVPFSFLLILLTTWHAVVTLYYY